jgi:hypothetical protein
MTRLSTIIGFLLVSGCASDLIAARNAECESASDHCVGQTAAGLLYLDTGNLPTVLGDTDRLVLCAAPVVGTCESTRLDLVFEGGPLTADVDPGIADQSGWKIRFSGLTVNWVEPPGTLSLAGRLRQLEFVFDPDDEHSTEITFE